MLSYLLTCLSALLTEPLCFLLSLTPLARLLPKTDHYAPHPSAPFEGYYTRIVTPENSTILLILSSVRRAPSKAHYLHFSHTPSPQSAPALRIDAFPTISDIPGERRPDGVQEFTRVVSDGLGYFHAGSDAQRYSLRLPDPSSADGIVEIDVTIRKRTEWTRGDPVSTPEGAFAALTRLLPLHWNVHSHRSIAEYTVRRRGAVWLQGAGLAHVEKNWGVSFPRGWTWIQGFSDPQHYARTATFCLAGGKILGQEAFLLGYRSRRRRVSFAPPTTLLPFCGATPWCVETHDSRRGTLSLRADNLMMTRRIVVEVSGPANHEGWVGLHCPLAGGHGNTLAYETFEARLWVSVSERKWPWQEWAVVEMTEFPNAALEFGGDYSFMFEK